MLSCELPSPVATSTSAAAKLCFVNGSASASAGASKYPKFYCCSTSRRMIGTAAAVGRPTEPSAVLILGQTMVNLSTNNFNSSSSPPSSLQGALAGCCHNGEEQQASFAAKQAAIPAAVTRAIAPTAVGALQCCNGVGLCCYWHSGTPSTPCLLVSTRNVSQPFSAR